MSKKKQHRKANKKKQSENSKKSLKVIFNEYLQYKYLGLIIACIYFVLLMFISLTYHKIGDYGIETDFFWGYVPEAKSFINGHIMIDQFRGPMYPIILGTINLLISDYFKTGIIIGVISASVIIYLNYELIKKIFSPSIAFFVTLLLAANPVFVQYTYSAGTDMVFNALAVAALFFFFKDKEINYKNLVIAAFLGGLSYLTRYNGVFLLGFLFIIILINYSNLSWFRLIKSSLLFLAVFFITITPWGIYCLGEKGSFFYNENYKNIAYEVYAKGNISWDQFWFKESSHFTSLYDVISRDVSSFIGKIAGNIADHFLLDMEKLMGWYNGAFVILGLIFLIISNPLKRIKSRETGYYLSNLFFFALLLIVFYSERFSLFLIPFYALIAVQQFFRKDFVISERIPRVLGMIILMVLFITTLSDAISTNSTKIDSGPNELLVLQKWYEQNIPENERGKKIAARKPHVAYLLNMDFSVLPLTNDYSEFIEKLRENKVDYLYFSPIEASTRPQFKDLLNPNIQHPGLKAEVYFNNPPSVLYKVLKD